MTRAAGGSGPAPAGSASPGSRPEPVHLRTISAEATDLVGPDGTRLVRVRGTLVDRRPRGVPAWIAHDGEVIHHLEVTLTVRYPDFVVVDVEGRMPTVPYPAVCPDALPSLRTLVGLSVVRGFTRALNERLGRERGCTHVVALILAMAPVVRQGAGAAFGFVPPAPPEGGPPATGAQPWFVDSCQAWRAGGPLHLKWLAERPDEP